MKHLDKYKIFEANWLSPDMSTYFPNIDESTQEITHILAEIKSEFNVKINKSISDKYGNELRAKRDLNDSDNGYYAKNK